MSRDSVVAFEVASVELVRTKIFASAKTSGDPMSKFKDAELSQVRAMTLNQVLRALESAEKVIGWSEDGTFIPIKSQTTRRFHVSLASGYVTEIVVTTGGKEFKWYESRADQGGGGAIDLTMHLLNIDFVKAVKLLVNSAL